ncbi:MAG: Pimeloyl-ACP methyl ester carboxylesterase [Chloroflexi bacterium]|jgi:pimeloyl-ACP methyl ester carboxylesterase|nr:MAG: Pimeloyl-ACP methyl ester carboxylesterase [Chloroflexota bacterium]|tara:strand:- start:10593 stop:11387 length:795 start_codon:yes stop_codon:yes gene_type:complete
MYKELNFNVGDEFSMSYLDTGKVDSGNELILIHGWCSNKFHWNPQIEYFKNNFRVVAIDLRGHGNSSAPNLGYSFNSFSLDIKSLIDVLGITNPVIFGHSMGGAIAIYLANILGKNAKGLVMVDGSLNIVEHETQLNNNQRISSFKKNNYAQEIEKRYSNFFSHMKNNTLGKRIISDAVKTPEHVAYGSLLALYRDDVMSAGSAINIPALYIANAYSPRSANEVKTFVPNSTFAQVVQAGHFLHLEDIEQSNAMLNTFVNNVSN